MSRELMSFPIVQPTIVPRELMTSASSGSGTLHVASRRIPTASPAGTTFSASALKKISGRSASYTRSYAVALKSDSSMRAVLLRR